MLLFVWINSDGSTSLCQGWHPCLGLAARVGAQAINQLGLDHGKVLLE